MEKEFIIVGGGFAAFFVAHRLAATGRSFMIFDDPPKQPASKISAGVANPVIVKRFTLIDRAKEQMDLFFQTITEIEKILDRKILIPENVCRIFHSNDELTTWKDKSSDEHLKPFLQQDPEKFPGIKNEFGAGRVKTSARIDVDEFFRSSKACFKALQSYLDTKFDYQQLDLESNTYQHLKFKNIIFCEGIHVAHNPYFNFVPVIPNKGHNLIMQLAQEVPREILKKKHFLFKKNTEEYYYGGTYDRHSSGDQIDEAAITELKTGLREIIATPYQIKYIRTGFRATTKDRKPIVGAHPQYANFFILNGLGARGVLNGIYYADVLINSIEKNLPVPTDVDVKRFCSN